MDTSNDGLTSDDEPLSPLFPRLDLDPAHPLKGRISIVNTGDQPIRLWRPGNSWGDVALSFQLDGDRIIRRAQVYSRNVPAFIELSTGETYDAIFDLGDGQWEPSVTGRAGGRLTACFDIVESTEAQDLHVWTGSLRSQAVKLL